jgi:hypothetical protein
LVGKDGYRDWKSIGNKVVIDIIKIWSSSNQDGIDWE